MTSTLGMAYTPDIQRYIVQTSDVLSDHRVTVAPLADPSTVIWYTERYIAYPNSGPAEIVENIVHQPTNTICWSVHRPTDSKRQGWYVRLRAPVFPPGVWIPLSPVSTTSPYYVDGALTFKCRTQDPRNRPPDSVPRPLSLRSDRTSVSSTSSSSRHSYPPTPTTSPPHRRRDLPPLKVPPSNQGRSLTGEPATSPFSIGEDHDDDDDDSAEAKTPTVANTPTFNARPPSLSNGKGKEISVDRDERHLAPPVPPQPKITEFILVPLSQTANASSGPFINLSSSNPFPSQPAAVPPSPRSFPHSHHRTFSNTQPPDISAPIPPRQKSSGILSKAIGLLKSSLPTALSNTIESTMQGNSFTITRVPDSVFPPAVAERGDGATSPPPPYTSTTSLIGATSTANLNGNGSVASLNRPSSQSRYSSHIPNHSSSSTSSTTSLSSMYHSAPNAISSTSFVQPLPPPLISFTDQTNMFPITFGLGGLFGKSSAGSSLSGNSGSNSFRTSLQPPPRNSYNGYSPGHTPSASLPTQGAPSSLRPISFNPTSSSSHPPFPPPQDFPVSSNEMNYGEGSRHSRPSGNPNFTTLGTLTVSKNQLAELGVDTAFWITCALVFWGYLEEREGYLSAADD